MASPQAAQNKFQEAMKELSDSLGVKFLRPMQVRRQFRARAHRPHGVTQRSCSAHDA